MKTKKRFENTNESSRLHEIVDFMGKSVYKSVIPDLWFQLCTPTYTISPKLFWLYRRENVVIPSKDHISAQIAMAQEK